MMFSSLTDTKYLSQRFESFPKYYSTNEENKKNCKQIYIKKFIEYSSEELNSGFFFYFSFFHRRINVQFYKQTEKREAAARADPLVVNFHDLFSLLSIILRRDPRTADR